MSVMSVRLPDEVEQQLGQLAQSGSPQNSEKIVR